MIPVARRLATTPPKWANNRGIEGPQVLEPLEVLLLLKVRIWLYYYLTAGLPGS